MYVCMYVLGGDCLFERVKRWLAGCWVDHESRVGEPGWPHTRRPRNLYVFFLFAFCLSIVVSDRAKKKQNTQHESCMKVVQNSAKNRSEIDEKSTRIDEKSMKFRFWAVLSAQGRYGEAPGRAQDGSRRPKAAPGPILERPGPTKSGRESSKSVPRLGLRHTQAAPERYPSAFGTPSIVKRPRRTFF